MIPTDLTLTVTVVCILAFLLAGTVKGAIGSGLPAVSVPIMVTVIEPALAVSLTVVPVVLANIWQVLQGGHYREVLRRFWPFLLALAVGVTLGTQVLVTVDTQTMALIVGSVVVASTAAQFLVEDVPISAKVTGWLNPAAGFVLGIAAGITAIFTPAAVYISALRLHKDVFVAQLALLAMCGTAPLYISLAVNQVLSWRELAISAAAFVPVGLGMVLGKWLRDNISQRAFQLTVRTALILLGSSLIVKGLV